MYLSKTNNRTLFPVEIQTIVFRNDIAWRKIALKVRTGKRIIEISAIAREVF